MHVTLQNNISARCKRCMFSHPSQHDFQICLQLGKVKKCLILVFIGYLTFLEQTPPLSFLFLCTH